MQLAAAGRTVEVLAVTADQALLAALRDAVGEQQRIWHANTSEQAVELIMAGQVGVVVLDTLVSGGDSASFCERIRAQFPDLVLVVAGSTEDQTQLVKHISSGDIYRFLHKPVSTARARQFIEAGVRRHLDGRTFTPAQVGSGSGLRSRFFAIGGIAIGVIAAVVFLVAFFSGGERPQTNGAAGTGSTTTRASELKSAVPPASVSTFKPAQSAPSAAPASAASAVSADRLLKQAEAALLAGELDEAASHLAAARSIDADHAGLAFLSAQLDKEQARQKRSDRIGTLLKQAGEHLRAGRLIEPEGGNARASVEAVLAEEPGNAAAQQISHALTEEMVAKAREAIMGSDFAAAEQWLTQATELKASPTLTKSVQAELQSARSEFARKEEADKAREAAEKEVADRQAAAEREHQAFLTNVVPATSIPRDKQVQPVYPPSALNKGIEGWVEMDFTVAVDGRVKDIELRGAQPQGVFEQAARTAVAQWKYKPVVKDGRPVEQRARLRLRFAVGK